MFVNLRLYTYFRLSPFSKVTVLSNIFSLWTGPSNNISICLFFWNTSMSVCPGFQCDTPQPCVQAVHPRVRKWKQNALFFTHRWSVIFFCKILLYCTQFSYIYICTHNSQKVNVMHNVAESQKRLYVTGFIYKGCNLLPTWFECMSNWFVVVCRSHGTSSLQNRHLKCVLLTSIRQHVKWNT